MQFDPHHHHRRSIRLQGYDYSQAGAYFITLVTDQRTQLFGEIVEGEMRLSEMGRIADEHWRSIPDHFPQVELGAYVIMPDHVHGIFVLNGEGNTMVRNPAQEQFQKPVKGSIPTIIRTYKASVTHRIQKELHSTGIWLTNYYEHVIRSAGEYERITKYIEANISRWGSDQEKPHGPGYW